MNQLEEVRETDEQFEALPLRAPEPAKTPEELIALRARDIQMQIKNLDAIWEKQLKPEIKAMTLSGEVIGSADIGGSYDIQKVNTETFDAKAALKEGLITKDGKWEKFWTYGTQEKLVWNAKYFDLPTETV